MIDPTIILKVIAAVAIGVIGAVALAILAYVIGKFAMAGILKARQVEAERKKHEQKRNKTEDELRLGKTSGRDER